MLINKKVNIYFIYWQFELFIYLFIIVLIDIWDIVSCIPNWFLIYHVANDDLKFLILWPPPPECLNCRFMLLCLKSIALFLILFVCILGLFLFSIQSFTINPDHPLRLCATLLELGSLHLSLPSIWLQTGTTIPRVYYPSSLVIMKSPW